MSLYHRYSETDLFVTDVASGGVTPLVRQPGREALPAWSSDGRRIAFVSQAGRKAYAEDTGIGILDIATGALTYPAMGELRRTSGGAALALAWDSADGLLVQLPFRMTHQLFRLSDKGALSPWSNDLDASYGQFRLDPQHRRVIFVRQTVSEPRDLWVSPLSRFKPRRLTKLNPDLRLPHSRVERLSWRSTDGKWNLAGALITPTARSDRKRPLIVKVGHGPSITNLAYNLGDQFPVQSFLEQGYAVLTVNTRGREGEGIDFARALIDAKDFGVGPLSDLMSGIDHVLALHSDLDKDRLALAGFSYGGYLTAYAITKTDRFRVATIQDGKFDFTTLVLAYAANKENFETSFAQRFYDPPYTRKGYDGIRRNSALTHICNVRTPALLEFGELSPLALEGGMYHHGLTYFGTPSRLVIYPRTAHGIYEPALMFDSVRRNIDWFAQWIDHPIEPIGMRLESCIN